MAGLTLKISGADIASGRARGIAKRAKNLTVVQLRMSERIIGEAQEIIAGRRKTDVATGNLAGSLNHRLSRNSGSVGTNLVYASIQQSGGTIFPKRAKNLAIPATKTLRGLRKPPRDFAPGELQFIPTPNAPKATGVLIRSFNKVDRSAIKSKKRPTTKAARIKEAKRVKERVKKEKVKGSRLHGSKRGDVMFWLVPSVTVPDYGPFLVISRASFAAYKNDIRNYIVRGSLP